MERDVGLPRVCEPGACPDRERPGVGGAGAAEPRGRLQVAPRCHARVQPPRGVVEAARTDAAVPNDAALLVGELARLPAADVLAVARAAGLLSPRSKRAALAAIRLRATCSWRCLDELKV